MSQWNPVISGSQNLHHLHCQRDKDQLSSFRFTHRYTKILLPASHNHVFHDVIDCEVMDSGPASDNVTDFIAMVPEELCSAGCRLPPRCRREHAIQVALVRCGPVDGVVSTLLSIVITQGFIEFA